MIKNQYGCQNPIWLSKSSQAEDESDLKRMCQPGESCKNQVGSQLLLQREREREESAEREKERERAN